MDSTALSNLLESLRSSVAFQGVATPSTDASSNARPNQLPASQSQDTVILPENPPSVSSRLSSLLARLRGEPEATASKVDHGPPDGGLLSLESVPHIENTESFAASPAPVPSMPLDNRHLTYAQSLSLVESLLQDPFAVSTIIKLKATQDDMEDKLWKERQALEDKYQSLLKPASGSSRWDPQAVEREMDTALLEFDRTKVLPAWDALIRDQQAVLEKLGVPSMFSTKQPIERSRQQRVIRVIEDGLADAK